jgi:hypothetical protein
MSTCSVCAAEIQEGQGVLLQGKRNSPHVTVCANCADEMDRTLKAETESSNLAGALVLGLIAAAVSSLIWYGVVVISEYQVGLIAILVGWLVGQGVMLGAGRKRGAPLQIMSVVITLVAMVASEYFVWRHFLVLVLKEEEITGIPLFLPLGDMIQLVMEGIRLEPMTLLFWAIALYVAFRTPAARRIRRQSPWSAPAEADS